VQSEIAANLDRVANIIEARERELQLLDDLIKARFAEMFGMPGTDTKGWGLNSLGSVCHINPKKSQDYRLGSGVMVSFVPMPAVTETGEIDLSSTNVYDEVKTGFTYFAEGDVLFAKITPCMENGKGAVAKGLCNGIGFGSTEFHVLRPINGRTNPYWLYTLTAFPQFRTDAAGNMTGSAGQRRVPATFLENYRVSVPPIELQQQFADFVAQVDKSKLLVRIASKYRKTICKTLLQSIYYI
jgi:type I restriction enzyme S subunit